MLSFGSASSALPHHQEVLDRLRRTSAQLDTLQRRLAFERVYEELGPLEERCGRR